MTRNIICKICNNNTFTKVMEVADYSVSKEIFDIEKCEKCEFVFTSHAPNEEKISPYYKFDNYISHTNSNKGIVNKLYHFVRKYTLNKKQHLINKYLGSNNKTIADYGAGTGAFVKQLNDNNFSAIGFEPDADARENAKEINNINLLPTSEFVNQKQNSIAAITLWHVLEHIHNLDDFFVNAHKILEENGHIFIAVPNHKSYDAKYFKQYWAAYDVPRHLYHFDPNSIKKLLAKHGFELIKMKPMWFDTFYVSMLSTQYQAGKILWQRVLWAGLVTTWQTLFKTQKSSSIIYIAKKK